MTKLPDALRERVEKAAQVYSKEKAEDMMHWGSSEQLEQGFDVDQIKKAHADGAAVGFSLGIEQAKELLEAMEMSKRLDDPWIEDAIKAWREKYGAGE